MLLDKARALVLPGHHGRVDGVVAGVWRSVAVIVGRGEKPSLSLDGPAAAKIVPFLKASSRLSLPVMRLWGKL